MKKLFICLAMFMTCGVVYTTSRTIYAKAEETSTSVVIPPSSVETSTSVPKEPTQEEIEETMKNKLTEWLNTYLDSEMVARIITWVTQGGLITFCAATYLKYRKYKATTLEDVTKLVHDKIVEELSKNFKDLDQEMVKKLTKEMSEVVLKIDNMMKALALAQDKTAEGKIALLNLISDTTDKEEVKAITVEVKEEIQKEQKVENQVKEKVSQDYTPVD